MSKVIQNRLKCPLKWGRANLSRNLDFLLLNSKINSSHNTIQKIVTTSFRIIHAHYRRACGNHEDSACMVGGISYINRTLYKTGLSEDDAICFSEEIKRKTFHPGDKIYRIIEDQKFAIGKWWLQSKPSDFKSWRSDYAVLKSWNQGGLCVEVTLNKDIEVWVGNAAFQVVPMSLDRCYLLGGSEQLLIEPSDLQQLNRKIDPWP